MATTEENCEVVDNWEDIDDLEVLDKTFPKSQRDNFKASNGQVVIEGEDSVRTQYTPPEPLVKILKRPNKHSLHENTNQEILVNGEWRNKQPVKSLQQREIEYREARLRILGEAKSPEDELDVRLSKMEFNPTTVTLLRPNDAVHILRTPRGPDGSKGFTLKR